MRVPVPPFGTYEEGRLFHRLLLLFLRDLKEAGAPVSGPQYLLAGVLELHGPASPWADGSQDAQPRCSACRTPFPCRTTLAVAVSAGLPITWATPVQVGRALRDAGVETPRTGGEITAAAVRWGTDWGAQRAVDGTWEVGFQQDRGEVELRTLPDDAAMARYLAERGEVGLARPFPYGWVEDRAEVAAVRDAAFDRAADWRERAELPFLAQHREFGAARGREVLG
ncbi:hypothetical protein [Kitasatospora sp. McL0602]|uniref:hypothetical protein n=1 Tax=Kitasatospora sp. McL0602 TaxID=3439530 RepID=UPI003F8CC69A